jgi:GMP synthase (glutamine-hydrolysing)
VPHEGPGWLAELLDDAGVEVDVRRMYDGAALPAPAEPDALVVLGGPMGVHDDERVSWIGPVKRLLADVVERGTPTLGICLGAQLLVAACGGAVQKGTGGPELGLGPLTLAEAAAEDPLLYGIARETSTVQWHWDHIARLPDAAVLLASSPLYVNQAFRLGERAWGMQFHPEVTLPLVAQWAQDDAAGVRAAGLDPTAIVGAVADSERLLLETWTPVLERFAILGSR